MSAAVGRTAPRVCALRDAYRRGELVVSADPVEMIAARRSAKLPIDARRVAERLLERNGDLVFDELDAMALDRRAA